MADINMSVAQKLRNLPGNEPDPSIQVNTEMNTVGSVAEQVPNAVDTGLIEQESSSQRETSTALDRGLETTALPGGQPSNPGNINFIEPKQSLIVKLPVVIPFPFMKLPLEIRTMVYKELLVLDNPINFMWYVGYSGPRRCQLAAGVKIDKRFVIPRPALEQICGLLRTSSAIHEESFRIMFGYNTFHFDELDMFESFVSKLRPDYRRSIARMTLCYFGRAPARAMKLLRECVGLRSLSIILDCMTVYHMPYNKGTGFRDIKKLHGMNDLLKVRGIRNLQITLKAMPERFSVFNSAVQVLKEPHSDVWLRRQEAKDYPQKATRTIFGKANVMTRTEKKVMGTQSSASK